MTVETKTPVGWVSAGDLGNVDEGVENDFPQCLNDVPLSHSLNSQIFIG